MRRAWWRIRYGWTTGDTAAVVAWTVLCGIAALAVGWLS